MKKILLLLVLFFVICFPGSVFADGYLIVQNWGDSHADLWVLPRSTGRYSRPPKHLRPNSTTYLRYRDGELYWLVVVQDRRQVPVGWVNISKTLQKFPGAQLHLENIYQANEILVWSRWRRRWVTRESNSVRVVPRWTIPHRQSK